MSYLIFIIFAENRPALAHNEFMVNKINKNNFQITANDQVPGKLPKHVYDRILSYNQSKTGGLPYILNLKINARAMLTINIDINDKLIKGQIGTVVNFLVKNGIVEKVYIRFDDVLAGLEKQKTDHFALESRVSVDIRTNEETLTSPVIKRIQFPLMLSWACTVHKVQGLSLDKIVVSFDLLKNLCCPKSCEDVRRSFSYWGI